MTAHQRCQRRVLKQALHALPQRKGHEWIEEPVADYRRRADRNALCDISVSHLVERADKRLMRGWLEHSSNPLYVVLLAYQVYALDRWKCEERKFLKHFVTSNFFKIPD